MSSGVYLSQPSNKMDNSDKISTITNDNPEDRDEKDVKRYPDSGGYVTGGADGSVVVQCQ